MTLSAPSNKARLWVCHPCRMIGDNDAAERHVELKGHRIEQLDQETSDAVREEWEKQEATMFDPAIAAHMLRSRDA
jgi:hypothetical protein